MRRKPAKQQKFAGGEQVKGGGSNGRTVRAKGKGAGVGLGEEKA